jgi:hypothetical protein
LPDDPVQRVVEIFDLADLGFGIMIRLQLMIAAVLAPRWRRGPATQVLLPALFSSLCNFLAHFYIAS